MDHLAVGQLAGDADAAVFERLAEVAIARAGGGAGGARRDGGIIGACFGAAAAAEREQSQGDECALTKLKGAAGPYVHHKKLARSQASAGCCRVTDS